MIEGETMTRLKIKLWVMDKLALCLLNIAKVFIFLGIHSCACWLVKHGIRLIRKSALILADFASTPEERDDLLRGSADLVQSFYDKVGKA